jgi:hypothetical protein
MIEKSPLIPLYERGKLQRGNMAASPFYKGRQERDFE